MTRVADRWPVFAGQLSDALLAGGHIDLARQVPELLVHQECGCGDSFCESFYTAPKPDGAYGPGHVNVVLDPPWSGMLILDVVHGQIRYVEVIDHGGPLE